MVLLQFILFFMVGFIVGQLFEPLADTLLDARMSSSMKVGFALTTLGCVLLVNYGIAPAFVEDHVLAAMGTTFGEVIAAFVMAVQHSFDKADV